MQHTCEVTFVEKQAVKMVKGAVMGRKQYSKSGVLHGLGAYNSHASSGSSPTSYVPSLGVSRSHSKKKNSWSDT